MTEETQANSKTSCNFIRSFKVVAQSIHIMLVDDPSFLPRQKDRLPWLMAFVSVMQMPRRNLKLRKYLPLPFIVRFIVHGPSYRWTR